MTATDAYLAVRDLTIATASGTRLVDGVGFEAAKGKTLGIIGTSGSGKSLTCLAVLGLLPKELKASGEILLDGAAMALSGGSKARAARKGKAAMIMQNPMSCFNPVFSIRAHFKETLAAHDAPRSENTPGRWKAALAETDFPEPEAALGLYPFQMSGGMLQRVMIALALAVEAPFLIADEATTDLDIVAQARVLALLERLRQTRGMGILLITHDLSVIARLADDVVVMRHGRILHQGTVSEYFDGPGEPYAATLLEAHRGLHGLHKTMPAASGSAYREGGS